MPRMGGDEGPHDGEVSEDDHVDQGPRRNDDMMSRTT